jgi:hypothetical protein
VQVVAADLGKTFATESAHGSINMEAESGETFIMFTSRYAAFRAETVPQGSGTLKGIASVNNDVYQILPTTAADYAGMTGARFGVTNTLTVSRRLYSLKQLWEMRKILPLRLREHGRQQPKVQALP